MTVRLSDPARDGYSIAWDNTSDEEVTVYAVGGSGDVHNKLPQPNNGRAGVFFPAGFSGAAAVEIRDADGKVLDSGMILVGNADQE